MTETAPGRYRSRRRRRQPGGHGGRRHWLAERDAALTDLVAGRTLEEAYFEAVGAADGEPHSRTERRGRQARSDLADRRARDDARHRRPDRSTRPVRSDGAP